MSARPRAESSFPEERIDLDKLSDFFNSKSPEGYKMEILAPKIGSNEYETDGVTLNSGIFTPAARRVLAHGHRGLRITTPQNSITLAVRLTDTFIDMAGTIEELESDVTKLEIAVQNEAERGMAPMSVHVTAGAVEKLATLPEFNLEEV